MIKPIKVLAWKCMECEHVWLSQQETPKKCPKCQKAASGLGRGRPSEKPTPTKTKKGGKR